MLRYSTRPALIRIERVATSSRKTIYWRVWIYTWRSGATGPGWGEGRCRGATELREAVEQARRARRTGVW